MKTRHDPLKDEEGNHMDNENSEYLDNSSAGDLHELPPITIIIYYGSGVNYTFLLPDS